MQLDRADAVTDPGRGSRCFYDLHLIMRLVRGSWPFAAQFAPPHIDLDTIDEHVTQLGREMTLTREAGKPVRNHALLGPSEDGGGAACEGTVAGKPA